MDLHQEAMAALETVLDTPWGPPAMPELRTITRNSTEQSINSLTIPRRWMGLRKTSDNPSGSPPAKLTREASTSMEEIAFSTYLSNEPGVAVRPKSMCAPNDQETYNFNRCFATNFHSSDNVSSYENAKHRRKNAGKQLDNSEFIRENASSYFTGNIPNVVGENMSSSDQQPEKQSAIIGKAGKSRRTKSRRNPVQRAASRLYRAGAGSTSSGDGKNRDCIGPEFVVRSALPSKQYAISDTKGNVRRTVTVILLNGQKVDVVCNPNTTTAGKIFELIIQKELIEENFMLGLSALIAGDFVFLPSDTRVCKAIVPGTSQDVALILFLRIRFFLPSLRGVRGNQARHLLYLQLRRSILEHQLPCSFGQLVELNGFALQAEFGDFNEREHGSRDYFLLEHYVPESMTCAIDDSKGLRADLTRAHKYKLGLDTERAEEDFILLAQTLPHYGGHFYTATWVLKDNTQRNVWLYISAQGINIYERNNAPSYCGPILYEMFEWRTIQTLCYSKHYLCILPHSAKLHAAKLNKYKLKMDHKKSYFTFRLASLHHQFFLRLRTEFTSLQTLSQQFGIPLKDMKNETNSLFKLEALTNPYLTLDKGSVNAETEFRIEFKSSFRDDTPTSSSNCQNNNNNANGNSNNINNNNRRRSKSVNDFKMMEFDEPVNEEHQNKENERPTFRRLVSRNRDGLILDSSCLSGLSNHQQNAACDKRRGVKMGTRAFSNNGHRVSRSMEAVNVLAGEDLEQLSLQSVSINYSSSSTPQSPTNESKRSTDAYIIGSSIKSDKNFLPDLQESLSRSLIDKLNNFSFDDERILQSVTVVKDTKGSLGMQITEGSDGKVYVQSVIHGGPAYCTGNIHSGDQIIAVDGRNLLRMKYEDALDVLLKNTAPAVNFVLSQYITNKSKVNYSKSDGLERTMNKLKQIRNQPPQIALSYDFVSPRSLENISVIDGALEKHLTENCYDVSNLRKYNSIFANMNRDETVVPYHKHVRYEIETGGNDSVLSPYSPTLGNSRPIRKRSALNRTLSKSCTQIYVDKERDRDADRDRAVIVDMIPKRLHGHQVAHFHSMDRKLFESAKSDCISSDRPNNRKQLANSSSIALPRSLGLSRKWRGPVRYPVTPVKKTPELNDNSNVYVTTSDEEQVFI
ncbi:FERM domain containing protein [Oryctes borbonicus]|uniref:FERM domain containing protein n=1 Tax=Oryctes borbonicus TaxID=1629725 RepID=A0A0T6BDP3_9SCAR|nr:FERM domain containing protein [Oryctes borbonicus]